MSNQAKKEEVPVKKLEPLLVSFNTNDYSTHFEILKVLGKGGQGVVYLANSNKFSKNFALKTVKVDIRKKKFPMYYVKSVMNMLYLSSISTTCNDNMMCSYGIIMNSNNVATLPVKTRLFLENFNLIYVSDALNDKTICLLYEYIEGTVLYDLVKPAGHVIKYDYKKKGNVSYNLVKPTGQIVSFEIIKHIVHQLLKILVHIHSLGFAHLDIKPENIILEKNTNNLKLIDVEFLCHINDETCVATGISKHYSSPNLYNAVYNGNRHPNEKRYTDHSHMLKADVFSAGLVIYELLMKKPLMSSITIFGQSDVGPELEVDLPEHLSMWKPLIQKMIRRQFKERISSREALNEFETIFPVRKVYNNVDGGSLRLGRKKLTRKQNRKSRRSLSIKNPK